MKMEFPGKAIPPSKQHIALLDGLRGIAAIAVVIFHFMECVFSDYSKNFIGHGFLAVDFFFCLSGFIMGYAYDDRIGSMGLKAFFRARLIRLHPLVILGSVIGLSGFYLDPFNGHSALYSTARIGLIFFCSILVIPFPVMPDRYFNLFSFNAPAWSLFWEYVANICYAIFLRRISRRLLQVLTLLAAICLCFAGYRAGNLMGGWSGGTFWDGLARISYSFLAGLLIRRSNWIIKSRLGFPALAALLSLAFLMPYFKMNWLAETLVVLFYFPLLISLGAGGLLKPGLQKLCELSGKISYPLYMTHYAAIWIFAGYYNKYKPGMGQLTIIIIGGLICLLGLAYLVMVLYDIPVRKYLVAKAKGNEPANSRPGSQVS